MADDKTPRKRSQAKDRVLQARIPEQLDEELRGRAEQLGLSVSTIVRNVLLHTFDLVEGVVTDSSQIARALSGRQEKRPPDQNTLSAPSGEASDTADAVLGWQTVILNKNAICEQCNAILPLGDSAAIAVPTGPRALLICLSCLALRTSPAAAPKLQPLPKKQKKEPASKAVTGRRKTTRQAPK